MIVSALPSKAAAPFADFLPWADPYISSLVETLLAGGCHRHAVSTVALNDARRGPATETACEARSASSRPVH